MNRLSVLHLLAPCEAGGLESVVRLLAIGQRDRGYAVRVGGVVSPEYHDHPFLRSLREAGVDTACLTIPDRAYLRERRWVRELCRRGAPDIVHTHGFRSDVVDAPVARRLGMPTIATVHGFTGGGWKVRMYERIQRRAFRRFDAVVAVSRALEDALLASGVRRDRVHLVPNAYTATPPTLDRTAARRGLSLPDDGFVIAWVGRLSREKGVDVFVEAVARLWDLPVTVSVFGAGPEQETSRSRAGELGLTQRITWHGIVQQVASYFHAFDALVLSSRTEGSPIVLFEAMAANLPIVATPVGGVRDVLSPAEAVLVPPDDPAALAEGIREVYRDRERAASRADAARRRLLAEFEVEAWVSRYEALYRRMPNPSLGKRR